MTYYDEFMAGHLVLPHALLEHFAKIFPSSEDFLIWLYFYENRDTLPSEIARKIGKSLPEVNHSITSLQNFGALKVTLVELNGDVETIFDVSPAFKHLDDLSGSNPLTSAENQEEGQLKELVGVFEAEMGVVSPMQVDELRAMLFEDKYDLNLIKLALREAVLNRKLSLKYIKGILRNWHNDGITSVQAAENRENQHQESKSATGHQDFYIPMDGPWN